MQTTVRDIKKRTEQLPENFREYVRILSMQPPYKAAVQQFNDPTAKPYLVIAETKGGKINVECTCAEQGVCDHIAAFFQLLTDIKDGTAAAPNTTAPQPEQTAGQPGPEAEQIPEVVGVEEDDDAPPEPTGALVPIVATGLAPAILRPELPVAQLLALQNDMSELITKALMENRDFGTIPGTNKPTLLKPGAERIIMAFGAYPEYQTVVTKEDPNFENKVTIWEDSGERKPKNWEELKAAGLGRNRKVDGEWQWQVPTKGTVLGLYEYTVRCVLRKRGTNAILGTGEGSCSSLEAKYQSRPRDLANTIRKMAQKRALVGTVLNTFALSDRFTQDVEDMGGTG